MSELTVYQSQDHVLATYDDVERAAKAMAASGFFQDTKQASQAIVKILAAREIGFGPFAGMTGINIIQGKPAFGANIMAAAVKRSGRYNYRVTEMTDKACVIEFMEFLGGKWQMMGVSSFTIEDAKKAATKNTDKFPRNMLFARAMSNGVRWYCPDVMNGSIVYTPEELGAEVDQDGEVISEAVVVEQPAVEPEASEVVPEPTKTTEPEPNNDPFASTRNLDPKTMTIEQAKSVRSGTSGQSYGDLSVADLANRFTSLSKALKDKSSLSGDEVHDYEVRTAAVKLILKEYNSK